MGSTNRDRAIRIVLLALAAASVCSAQQPAAAPSAAAQPAPAAVVSLPADAPLTPPKVVCTGDQMTISANNSTLSSVLAEVHRCMGTRIDIPDAAGSKRMFDRIGPGPASQVLDQFLSATGYNYIIGSSPANQEKIESIMLLARSADAGAIAPVEDSRAGSLSRRAFLQMHQASIPHPMTEADTAAAASATAPATASATAPATDAASPEPATSDATPAPAGGDAQAAPVTDPSQKPADSTPAAAAQPETPPTPPPSTNPATGRPTTTQDQINNMQQMFELRKQMNQQTQSATPPQN